MTTTYVLNEGVSNYTNSPYEYSVSQTNTSINPMFTNENIVDNGTGSLSFYEIRNKNIVWDVNASFNAGTNQIITSATSFTDKLSIGNVITISGSTEVTNNIHMVVTNISSGVLTTNNVPVTVAGQTIRITKTMSIVNDGSNVLNRILPTSSTEKFDTLSNRESTAGYRLFLPEGTSLTMDSNHDYFVIIYSNELFNQDNINSHLHKTFISKITEQVSIDSSNDGIEFSPKLPYELTQGTKFAIYKGPHKTKDTEVVAIGYGLLGDGNSVNGRRYDYMGVVSKPSFYFYNDRLNTNNQLDYSEKYQLSRIRYEDNSRRYDDITASIFLTQSQHGSSTSQSTILKEYSPFTYNVVLSDNVSYYDRTITGANTGWELDKTAFRTELNEDYTFDHEVWDNCFRNSKRSTTNQPSTNLTGPNRHITYVESEEKTNIFPHLIDMNVFTTISKSGTYAEARFADPNRILDVKIKEMDDFKVRNILFEEQFDNDATAQLPGLAYYNDTNKVIIKGLDVKRTLGPYDSGGLDYLIGVVDGSWAVEAIKINDYYYKIAYADGLLDPLVLDTQTGLWTQTLTITHYRHIKDKKWSAGGLQDTTKINGVNYYRRKWSNITKNLLVDFNLNANYTSVLNLILKDTEYSGNRITLSSINEDKKLIEPNNLPSTSYNPAKQDTYLDYFSGHFIVDKLIYNGSIEFKEDYIEDGQLKYLISGRDNIHKLLGPIVNKDYLHSQDIIYSSDSPIQKIVITDVKTNAIETGDLTTEVTVGDSSSFTNKKLYRSDGCFIGKVKSVVGSTITFYAPARMKYSQSVHGFLYIENSNYLVSEKGLSTHIDAINKANNLQYTSGKGIYFTGGLTLTNDNLQFSSATSGNFSLGYDINSIKNIGQDNPFMFRLSDEISSTIKDIKTVNSLTNYNIVGITPQEGKDTIIEIAPTSPFILARVDSNSYDTRYTNSTGLYFLNTQGINSGGLVNLVSSETTTSSNTKKKGSTWTFKNDFFGTPIYRYTDLQKGAGQIYLQSFVNYPQTGVRTTNRAYAKNQGLLSGYATAFKFLEGYTSSNLILPPKHHEFSSIFDGSITDEYRRELPIESRGIYPVLGSNFADFNIYNNSDWRTWPLRKNVLYTGIGIGVTENEYNTYANTNIVQRYPTWVMPDDAGNTAFFTGISNSLHFDAIRDAKEVLQVTDPKTTAYHIFSPCDSETESMNNENHLGYSTNDFNFTDFNILLMTEPISEQNSISEHEHYLGALNSTPRINESYESLPITSASIQPKNMKRFSLGRLIEVGFDFHFNQIDLENPSDKNWETAGSIQNYTKFRMAEKTPVKVVKAASAGDLSIWISSGNWFDTPVLRQGTADTRPEQYDKYRRYKYLENLDYLFDSQGRFLGIPHYMVRGYFPATDLHGGGAIAMTITQNDTDFTDGSYTFNSDGSGGATGSYTTSGDGTFGGTQAFSVTVAGNTVTEVFHTGVNGSLWRAGDTITIPKADLGGSGNDLILTIQANQIGHKLTFYADGDANDLNTFPNDTKGIIFNNIKRGSVLQYGDSSSGDKLLHSLAVDDYLYAMRYEAPYMDVKHEWQFLDFAEDKPIAAQRNTMNLMRFFLRRNQYQILNARDSTSEKWRVMNEGITALQHPDYGGTLSENDQPGHISSNSSNVGGKELLPFLHGRTVNGSTAANHDSNTDVNLNSASYSTVLYHKGRILRRGTISSRTTAVRSGNSTGQINSFDTPYEFLYNLETDGDGKVTSLKVTGFNDQTVYPFNSIPNASGRDSYAPLEIGDELVFTGDYVFYDGVVWSEFTNRHDEFKIVVDAEFLRTISAGKISGRQNGTWGPATTHDRYWTGGTYWSEGSTELNGGIPGADTPRLNCPLAFKTHQLWDDLEFKFVDQIGMDWNTVAKGRRLLSPFQHAQYYVSKDSSYKYGNYDGFPFHIDNKAHSTIGGTREATGLTVDSDTSAGHTGTIAITGTPTNVNVGTTLAIWDSVDEPIIIGRISELTSSTIRINQDDGGTKVTLRAGETLHKVGVVPLQYWHMSRVIAAMSSNHQDMNMYGYGGANESYGIYGTRSSDWYTFGSPKMSSAIFQGGIFVVFKSFKSGKSDLPDYEAGASFKLGTDGYRHASNTGSATSYQSDIWSGKYEQIFTETNGNYYPYKNTNCWSHPIFPVHFNTYPGTYSSEFISTTSTVAMNYGTKNWFTERTDLNTTSTSSATHGSDAYFTNIHNKGRAKADFSRWGDNSIEKDGLGIVAAFKPQLYLCDSNNDTEFGGTVPIDNTTIGAADSNNRRTITFNLNGRNSYYTAFNSWLHFAPNLTGYYLVSNEKTNNSPGGGLSTVFTNHPLANIPSESEEVAHIPKYIHQIIDHKIVNWDGHGNAIHEIIIDNAANVSIGKYDYSNTRTIANNICGYRLMKLSETCMYEFTPNTIDIYSMNRSYSKLPFENKMYGDQINRFNTATADDDESSSLRPLSGGRTNVNDGVYSMYILLSAEPDSSGYVMYRDRFTFVNDWVNNTSRNMFLTDGVNSFKTIVTLNTSDKVVNVQEVSIDAISYPHALTFNETKHMRGLVSMGEIFNITVPSTFNIQHFKYGRIGSTFNIGEDVDDIINDLMESNNLVYNKKATTERYITSPNIKGADLYNSLLSVSRLKGLEPRVYGKTISIKEIDDSDDITDITITEGESKVAVSKRNKSTFDLYNEVIVYGDGYKAIKRNSQSIKEKGKKTLEETDLNLVTHKQVDDRARELLKLHTQGLNQIELDVGLTGLEYLEVGKIIKVDYPTEHIPVGKYLILEINYKIGGPMNLVLGFFTKNLDYRIGELITANKKINSDLRGDRYSSFENTETLLDKVEVRELRIEVRRNTFNYVTTGITTNGAHTAGVSTLNVNYNGNPNIEQGTLLYTLSGELVGYVDALDYPTNPGTITLTSGTSFILDDNTELVSGGLLTTFSFSTNFGFTTNYGFLGNQITTTSEIVYEEDLT